MMIMAHQSRLSSEARRLLTSRRTAALATVDAQGHPHTSMVPFAVANLAEKPCLVLLISGLAAHTGHILTDGRVSILVTDQEIDGAPVHALGRLSLSGVAHVMLRGAASADAMAHAYLRRFPEAEPIAQLGDFRYVSVYVQAVRQVAGFGTARDIPINEFERLLRAL